MYGVLEFCVILVKVVWYIMNISIWDISIWIISISIISIWRWCGMYCGFDDGDLVIVL